MWSGSQEVTLAGTSVLWKTGERLVRLGSFRVVTSRFNAPAL